MPVSNQSIREIVAEHPYAATVFHRFDIDLCSQADATLSLACTELQLSVDQVLEKLEEAERKEKGGSAIDPQSLSLERLIQHIVRIHHRHVRQELPALAEMARKLAEQRGERAPEVCQVEVLVERLRTEMLAHIQKEEQILFPLISQVAQGLPMGHLSWGEGFGSLAYAVSMMMRQHETTDRIIGELRQLTQGFEAPAWACVTHSALLARLRTFEADRKQHLYLENDILFPRTIQLESDARSGS